MTEEIKEIATKEEKKIEKVEKVEKVEKNKKEETSFVLIQQRVLPDLIEELLDKNIRVELSKQGYLVHGFYGMDRVLLQETDSNIMVATDHKNKKQVIKNFKDLVQLNAIIWSAFYKKGEFKKPDTAWFSYLLEYDCLELAPNK